MSKIELTTVGERRLVRWWWAIRGGIGHAGTVLMALGAVLLAFGTNFGWLFSGGVVASLVGLALQVRQRPRYRRLIENERQAGARARQRSRTLMAILDAGLRTLLSAAHVDAASSRASVYCHNDGKFFLVARVSESQLLQVVGRTTYPDNEGLIGMAWDKGTAVVTDLPADRLQWNSHNIGHYGMSEVSVAHLTMQSRSLVGLRLDEPGNPSRPVGLVVLESLTPRGVHGRTADELASSDAYDLLTQIMVEVVRCLDEDDVAQFREQLPN